ncbi:unnamed protein product [Anisakis simplex]|uniref:Uncharacterized protein n=1 Tax=Anisakis simplex TaxID=6269 RepID=A0A0M3JHE1_ANISI|nr:unnamed protein product [Anisakis simplex]
MGRVVEMLVAQDHGVVVLDRKDHGEEEVNQAEVSPAGDMAVEVVEVKARGEVREVADNGVDSKAVEAAVVVKEDGVVVEVVETTELKLNSR